MSFLQGSIPSEIGDCPTYNVDIIFGAAPNTLGALVSSMNSFSETEISDQSNSVYKQRMVDIMKIKQLSAIVDQKEALLKDSMRISLNNAMKICDDVDPLFSLIKTEVFGFNCRTVSTIYYTTLGSYCEGTIDSTQNFVIMITLTIVFSIIFYVGIFIYLIGGSYRRVRSL